MPGELASRLEAIVAEAVGVAGFDLDAFDVQQAGRRKVVKVVVDGDDGVNLDDVAEVSRAVSAALDANEHLIASAYTLEVTSPGVDRPLTEARHWRRAKKRLVRISPFEGADLVCRVGQAGPNSVRLLNAGEFIELAYSKIHKAIIEVEFKPPSEEDLKLLEDDASGMINSTQQDPKEESK